MVIGHTESRNNYEAIHQGEYISVSGVRPSDWSRFLRGKDIPINSLRGGVAVFNYYLHEECNGNMLCAAARYKGIQSSRNMKLAYQVINTYNKIMELEKQRDPSSFGSNGKKPTAKFGNLGQTDKAVKVTKVVKTKVKKDKNIRRLE